MRSAEYWGTIACRAAAGALAGVVALAVAGCASSATSPPRSSGSAAVDAEVAGRFFPATVAEVGQGVAFQEDVGRLRAAAVNVCVSHMGFGAAAQRYLDFVENEQINRTELGWQPQAPAYGLVDLRSVKRSGMLAPILTSLRLPAAGGLSGAEIQRLRAGVVRCVAQSNGPYLQLMRHGEALQQLWANAELRLQHSAAVRPVVSQFGSCLRRRGVPSGASGSLLQFQSWLAQQVNVGATARPGSGPGPAPIQHRLQLDARWSDTFVQCAGPLLQMIQLREPGLQQRFLQKHYQQITTLDELAARFLAVMQRSELPG